MGFTRRLFTAGKKAAQCAAGRAGARESDSRLFPEQFWELFPEQFWE